jgi:hypothetical protein
MAVLVTVRRSNGQGEILGNFLHPAAYEGRRISMGGRPYEVVGRDMDEGPGKQTLYVVPLPR